MEWRRMESRRNGIGEERDEKEWATEATDER